MSSNILQIENDVKKVLQTFDQKNFIYELLLAYGLPKATIKRQQLSQEQNMFSDVFIEDVAFKKKVYFRVENERELPLVISELADKNSYAIRSYHPRFVIVTDFNRLMAVDTKTDDSLDIPFEDFIKHYDFFLPWAGMEKTTVHVENPADVRAAEKMAKLFDEIKRDNPDFTAEFVHCLNVFLTRLLFCFFAEDTEIFPKGAFTQTLSSHTQPDGSDLDSFLARLFLVMNTPVKLRPKDLPEYLNQFPYVNGGLFRDALPLPKLSLRSRNAIIKNGELNWADINPDIFGSMMQGVVNEDERTELGMHYTSVPNIMKVIKPLFLDDLQTEFERVSVIADRKKRNKELMALLDRLASIRIFDPACGSGNFLIIAYRELRKLEIEIIKLLNKKADGKKEVELFALSHIELRNFYGIEISDFSCEVAKLSLWLAEHQMNMIFKQEFGHCNPTLPLQEAGQIVCGNATRINWADVCPQNGQETYVLGNPPYVGSRKQNNAQKEDLKYVFNVEYKTLDYICAWFYLAANYIRGYNAKAAFVSTNSLSQGELVSLTWPRILRDGIEIGFAHKDFKWQNNAKFNAAVIVIVVGLQNVTRNTKLLIDNERVRYVLSITPYLTEGRTVYIHSRTQSISAFPEMNTGNMPADDGLLLLNADEREELITQDARCEKYIRPLISAKEFLQGQDRFCIWLHNQVGYDDVACIKERIEKLREVRAKSSRPQLAETPHLFAQIPQPEGIDFILVPRHSTENREYIPWGVFDKSCIAHDSCLMIPTTDLSIFSALISKIHMVWVRAVCGRIKTDFRYSKDIVYNNFPFPRISERQRGELSELAQNVLFQREVHSEKTLAELYDPEKMPEELKEAHHQLDLAVERCYRSKPFESDEERLEHLFNLYEKMIEKENEEKK